MDDATTKRMEQLASNTITSITNCPQDWSAMWCSGKALDSSIMHKSLKIQVMFDGTIIRPYTYTPSAYLKSKLVEAMQVVIERDKDRIIFAAALSL